MPAAHSQHCMASGMAICRNELHMDWDRLRLLPAKAVTQDRLAVRCGVLRQTGRPNPCTSVNSFPTLKDTMIARHWRGWTTLENGDAYENHLKGKVLPALKKLSGYRGMYILRRNLPEEVEFVVINLFDSMTDVQAFAGEDYSASKSALPESRFWRRDLVGYLGAEKMRWRHRNLLPLGLGGFPPHSLIIC